MNTKTWMTVTSITLAAAGLTALFAPDSLLPPQIAGSQGASLLMQFLGALYLAMAAMNWTARASAIGGVYARPVSLANFTHFFIGALLLLRFVLARAADPFLWAATALYVFFAIGFYWLVFHATGTKS